MLARAADPFACAVKYSAAEQSQKLLGRHSHRIIDALDFPKSGCPKPSFAPFESRLDTSSLKAPPPVVLYVAASMDIADTVTGKDHVLGRTPTVLLRSLAEAQSRLRSMTADERAGATVILAEGTHFLDESIVFTAEDSGTREKPVVWKSEGATVSGGKELHCKGNWKSLHNGVYECALPSGLSFDSLFVEGSRQVRARFPNGSPYIPNDGYADGCSSLAHFGGGVAFMKNMQVLASDGKTIISQLCAEPQNASVEVTVLDTMRKKAVNNCKMDQTQYHGTRFNETFNFPYWLTTAPSSIRLPPEFHTRTWKSPVGAVTKMMHPAGWGSWAFQVGSHDSTLNTLTFSKGGFQEARGNAGCGKMYVENIREELDAPHEWFHDTDAGKLYFIPPASWSEDRLQRADVVAPQLPRLFQFRGSQTAPVHDIILQDFSITHSAPTYLESYEAPSGGDWSIHRGGAVFVDGAERITLKNLFFDQVDGNGVFLSNHVVNSTVKDCDFWRTGDSAVALVGSVPLGDARKGSHAVWPIGNAIVGNWIEEVGVYMKQTSCVFRSLSQDTLISGNVCYNGPRAGINYNDAFMGGDIVESNIIFNMVRETGDHGTFNSWDRREYVLPCPGGHGACFTPRTIRVRHNMFIGPAGWNMDHDDGSSQYEDFSNVVYLGGFKYRDGVMRNMTGNLMVESGPVFQVTGFETNYWINNTVVSQSVQKICAPDTSASLTGTTYAVLSGSPGPSPPGPSPSPVPAGWTPTYCQSCENNKPLKDLGQNYGSVVDCISACGYEFGCKFANYAEITDNHCILYAGCSTPNTIDNCDPHKHDWWTTWELTGRQADISAAIEEDCWTHGNCICDAGTQLQITEDQLKQLIRDTVSKTAAVPAAPTGFSQTTLLDGGCRRGWARTLFRHSEACCLYQVSAHCYDMQIFFCIVTGMLILSLAFVVRVVNCVAMDRTDSSPAWLAMTLVASPEGVYLQEGYETA
jgi:hypothetical protein